MTTLNQIVLTLLEAEVTLYPADATGAPVLSAAIWTGAPAEKLTVRERWRIKETTPTGAKYPRRHPLLPDYEISLARVWLLQTADLTGWSAGWQNYVLDVVWTEAESGDWHRRTFYGVTIAERGLDPRDIDNGFTDDQSFAAQYVVPASGSGTPPAVSTDLPCTVQYTGASGVPVLLYTYDPGSQQFTAVGDPTTTAALSYVNDSFQCVFAGDAAPVLQCQNNPAAGYRTAAKSYRSAGTAYRAGSQGLFIPSLRATLPVPAELPRLDFYYGSVRTASLTRSGLYNPKFTQTTPVPAGFALFAGGTLIATLTAPEVQALEFFTG